MTRTATPTPARAGPVTTAPRLDRWSSPSGLGVVVVLLTFVVMGLAGAVLAVKLRPDAPAATKVERDVQAWRRAVRDNPRAAWASTGLGLALLRVDRSADARHAFDRSLALDETDWMASFQLGLLVKADDPARADALLGRAGEQAPTASKAAPYIALGDLRLARSDAEGARDAYEQAVADAPVIIEARVGLARAMEQLGDTAGALDQYRQAIRFDPSSQTIADAIARLSRAAG